MSALLSPLSYGPVAGIVPRFKGKGPDPKRVGPLNDRAGRNQTQLRSSPRAPISRKARSRRERIG